jgi:phosphate transport system permease protein
VARVVGTGIELLAAIPSIIYGMWGLFVLAPTMQKTVQLLGNIPGPLFSEPRWVWHAHGGHHTGVDDPTFFDSGYARSHCHDTSGARRSAAGMGSTPWEVTRHIIHPYGIRGLAGQFF